jgi:hypothetical protein
MFPAAPLLLGLALGMRHALDADHLVAMSTIVMRERSIGRAALLGGAWAPGIRSRSSWSGSWSSCSGPDDLGRHGPRQRGLWDLLSDGMGLTSAKVGDTIHKLCEHAPIVGDTVLFESRTDDSSHENGSRKARQDS